MAGINIDHASPLGVAIFVNAIVALQQDPVESLMDPSAIGGVSPLLTVVMVTVLSLAISGAVLSSSLNLSPDGGNHLTIRIPFVFHYSLSGQQVTAAFLPWMIVLLAVIVADATRAPVIREVVDALEVTAGGRFSAAQLLAALVSCPVCVILGVVRTTLFWLIAIAWITRQPPTSPDERAERLIEHRRMNPPADDDPTPPASTTE